MDALLPTGGWGTRMDGRCRWDVDKHMDTVASGAKHIRCVWDKAPCDGDV